jgi:DNA repair protein RadC
MSGTVLDPKIIFTTALNCTASGIIIAHNHPSGNLTPSVEDDRITAKIKEAGKMLDINLIDSVILTDEGYYSYVDNGKL